jgi:hypothetical protein
MRAVTLCAIGSHYRRVFTFAGLYSFRQVAVTRQTKLVLFLDDYPRGIASVGIVTGEALPVLERRMLKAARYCFHKSAVAPAAKVCTG